MQVKLRLSIVYAFDYTLLMNLSGLSQGEKWLLWKIVLLINTTKLCDVCLSYISTGTAEPIWLIFFDSLTCLGQRKVLAKKIQKNCLGQFFKFLIFNDLQKIREILVIYIILNRY